MAGHHLEHSLEGEITAFGMVRGTVEIGLAERADELEVPEAIRAEELECGGEFIGRVVPGPGGLIEGLQDSGLGGWGRENLAETEAEGDFAVGEVRDDLAWAPLAGSDGCGGLFRRESGDCLLKQTWGRGEHSAGILGTEVGCVRVGHAPQ